MASVGGMMIPRTGWNFEYFAEVASQAQGDAWDHAVDECITKETHTSHDYPGTNKSEAD